MSEFIRGNPRIVCAANRNNKGNIVIGIRHYCSLMRQNIIASGDNFVGSEQGFVDQFGNFYNREEAWSIAYENNQIIFLCAGQERKPSGTLYSENLY
jgi:hypothetical protein